MSNPRIRLVAPQPTGPAPRARKQLGRLLVDQGLISTTDLLTTLGLQRSSDAQLGHLLLARGDLSPPELATALAIQWNGQTVGYSSSAPDVSLQQGLEPHICLANECVPWMRVGNATLIATSAPEKFARATASLPAHLHPLLMAVATKADVERAIIEGGDATLAKRAEMLVPDALSCRSLPARLRTAGSVFAAVLGLGLILQWVSLAGIYATLFYFALSMVAISVLIKTSGAALQLLSKTPILHRPAAPPERLPRVSLLVPLHDEADILDDLLTRLSLLKYPKALLDVLLVIEEKDTVTRTHLSQTELPFWMRVLVVPEGRITTKPRAMNYALPFCRGEIVGIYDAEDAPDPGQIHDVAASFASSGPKTACIQAVLDFYNARQNAMARFFTIEYTTWFRLILPGLARLGFAIPLGGTSVFFRRDVLEELHGWDAHNVTEDADLGIRLARAGYHTILIGSVTQEEANCTIWRWIRQRSRWLKGYLITYFTHMRNPVRLLFDLGAWKFFGFQAFFLSTLSQFLLAPLIWSCMALYFGAPHWMQSALPPEFLSKVMIYFIAAWCASTAVNLVAISDAQHRHLMPWALGMSVYMGLGTIAIYKGAWEILSRPFYWDKTSHGKSQATLLERPDTLDHTDASAASSLSRVTKASDM